MRKQNDHCTYSHSHSHSHSHSQSHIALHIHPVCISKHCVPGCVPLHSSVGKCRAEPSRAQHASLRPWPHMPTAMATSSPGRNKPYTCLASSDKLNSQAQLYKRVCQLNIESRGAGRFTASPAMTSLQSGRPDGRLRTSTEARHRKTTALLCAKPVADSAQAQGTSRHAEERPQPCSAHWLGPQAQEPEAALAQARCSTAGKLQQ